MCDGDNMKLEDVFYREMNQSFSPIDNQSYIEQTSMLMESILRGKSNIKELLVLGSGRMHDMSLAFFLRNFSQITLTDIDIETVKESISNTVNSERIILKRVDYLGLEDTEFFVDLKGRLINAKSEDKVEEIIHHKIDKLLTYEFSKKFSKTYDVIYISPIYTQLLYRQTEQVIKSLGHLGLKKTFQDRALNTLLQEMIRVIDHFNQQAMALLDKNGLIFVASDIFSLNDDKFSLRIRNSIKSYDVMEELYERYKASYGLGLGDYGLISMGNLAKGIRRKWFIWNQSEHQTYAVKFRAFEKINE